MAQGVLLDLVDPPEAELGVQGVVVFQEQVGLLDPPEAEQGRPAVRAQPVEEQAFLGVGVLPDPLVAELEVRVLLVALVRQVLPEAELVFQGVAVFQG